MSEAQSIPTVDFSSHPAYRGSEASPSADEHAERLIAEIEVACAALAPGANAVGGGFVHRFHETMQPKFRQLTEIATANRAMSPAFRDYATRAIQRAASFLLEDLQARHRAPERDRSTTSPDAATQLEGVLRDGYARVDVGARLARQVWRRTWWERSLLRQHARSAPSRHCALALHDYSPASRVIQRALHAHGVLDAASAYIGRRMRFLYAALDYAHEGQRWFRDCYADIGLPTARTAYLHFDADSDVMKAMLYLMDVTPEGGAFRYVRGSHAWKRSAVRCALDRGFDAQQTETFAVEEDGLDYKLGYYRPRYKLPEYRSGLMQLPKALRGSTHFGDDVLDGTPLSESLLRQEEALVGKAGTLVIFDGSRGVHRGGQVTRGERWAVQIGMRAQDGTTPLPNWKGQLIGTLHYQAQRAKALARGVIGK